MYDLQNTKPVPADLGQRDRYAGELIPLGRLFDALIGRGGSFQGIVFTDCVIRGPAVIIPGATTQFVNSNLGDVAGDVKNLFLQAAGPRIIGGIPVDGCVFEGCLFVGVGFAGDATFIANMTASLKTTGAAAS